MRNARTSLRNISGAVKNLDREKVKVAVVGLGKMGLLHASLLNVLPHVELIALCDKSSLILRFSKKIFGRIRVVDDVRKLCDLDLDAVYVTTPISSHAAITKKIYLGGIASNLFVEKTLASSYDEAKELCDLAKSFESITMVGYMKRFAVTFMKAKDLLTQGTLGEVVSFNAYAYSSDFLERDEYAKTATRGGALRDLGCHVVDLALWFFGDLEVDSVKLQPPIQIGSESSVQFTVKKSDGLEGEFDVSQCMENYRLPELGLLINGSKGIMRANDDKVELKLNDGKSFTWFRHDLNDHVSFWLAESEYFLEDRHFVESILEQHSAEPSFYTASKVDYVIDQVKHRVGKNE